MVTDVTHFALKLEVNLAEPNQQHRAFLAVLDRILDEMEQGTSEDLPVCLDHLCIWAVNVELKDHLVHFYVFLKGLHEVFNELLDRGFLHRSYFEFQSIALVLKLQNLAFCHEAKTLTAVANHFSIILALVYRV